MNTQNPELKPKPKDTCNIQNILSQWNHFSVNKKEDELELCNTEGNDGETFDCGSVAIYDLIELAQRQLRTDNS